MVLMGGLDHVLSLISPLSYSNSVFIIVSWLSIWFLFAYLFALMFWHANNVYFKSFVYIILFSLFSIQHYLLQSFGSPITPTYLTLLAETNRNEINDFWNVYVSRVTILPTIKLLCAFIIFASVLELIWTKTIRNKAIKRLDTYLLGILLLPFLAFGVYSSRIYYSVLKESSPDRIRMIKCPDDCLSSIFSSLCTIRLMKKDVKEAIESTINLKDVSIANGADKDLNIVLIIGESFNKWHSNLYGYNKKTTPCLVREKDSGRLYVFDDVITPSNSTSVVLKNLLSCNNNSEGESWFSKPFFPALFKSAGYEVYLWDNQRSFDEGAALSYTLNGYIYNDRIVSSSYTKCNVESFPYDYEFFSSFLDSVGVNDQGRCLTIYHLIGQHFSASSRYPHEEQYTYFSSDSISRNEIWITDSHRNQIAEYDNATRYNDFVVGRILEEYKNSNCFLVYLSDHGEEVYDYRDQIGRDQGTFSREKIKYQYEIPFFIWTSDSYKVNHPDIIESIENNLDSPYMSDIVSHMLLNVAGIETQYYVSQYNILSPDYKCMHRIIEDAKQEYNSFIK